MPRPTTVRKVKSFLGSLSYNRRFIKGFSALARPLHKLTAKGTPFKWTPECERSFNLLKQALTSARILVPVDYDLKLLLRTDACNEGLGATLAQLGDDGKERHVIAYYSRTLNTLNTSPQYIDSWIKQNETRYGKQRDTICAESIEQRDVIWAENIEQRDIKWAEDIESRETMHFKLSYGIWNEQRALSRERRGILRRDTWYEQRILSKERRGILSREVWHEQRETRYIAQRYMIWQIILSRERRGILSREVWHAQRELSWERWDDTPRDEQGVLSRKQHGLRLAWKSEIKPGEFYKGSKLYIMIVRIVRNLKVCIKIMYVNCTQRGANGYCVLIFCRISPVCCGRWRRCCGWHA